MEISSLDKLIDKCDFEFNIIYASKIEYSSIKIMPLCKNKFFANSFANFPFDLKIYLFIKFSL